MLLLFGLSWRSLAALLRHRSISLVLFKRQRSVNRFVAHFDLNSLSKASPSFCFSSLVFRANEFSTDKKKEKRKSKCRLFPLQHCHFVAPDRTSQTRWILIVPLNLLKHFSAPARSKKIVIYFQPFQRHLNAFWLDNGEWSKSKWKQFTAEIDWNMKQSTHAQTLKANWEMNRNDWTSLKIILDWNDNAQSKPSIFQNYNFSSIFFFFLDLVFMFSNGSMNW